MKLFVKMAMVVCLVLIITGGSMSSMGSDAVNEKAARENTIRDLKSRYTRLSRKEPTADNILNSLMIQNAQGEKAGEIIAALKLIVSDKMDVGIITKEILACYDRNPNYWLIQAICADTLLRIDKPKGIDLSRKIIGDQNMSLEAKLNVAQSLVAAKVLIGYPVLREGLITSNDYQRRKIAIPLLAAFSAYDGVVYGEHGEKVDIHTLIADAKKSVKDQRIIDDLEKAELKYSKQPNQ